MTRHQERWALNVPCVCISAASRWAYTYVEFLLSRLDAQGSRRSFRPLVTFASSIAAPGDCVLLAGMDRHGFERGYDRIVLLGSPGRWTPARQRRLWTATIRRAFNLRAHLWAGRGDTLHQVSDRTWRQLSIDEADNLVPPGPWRDVPDVSG